MFSFNSRSRRAGGGRFSNTAQVVWDTNDGRSRSTSLNKRARSIVAALGTYVRVKFARVGQIARLRLHASHATRVPRSHVPVKIGTLCRNTGTGDERWRFC